MTGETCTPVPHTKTSSATYSSLRSIDRSELYVADEVFVCGTGVQVSPVVEVDHRKVGSGAVGPLARLVRDRYFDAVRGRLPEYQHWLTPIS